MREDRFPRIWTPSPENRDLRQLLWHRHRLVQMRTRIKNQLQALAMNENKCWKKKLWSERGRAELEKLSLAPWASRRRREFSSSRLSPSPTVSSPPSQSRPFPQRTEDASSRQERILALGIALELGPVERQDAKGK
jgi:hypothetical protein